MRYRVYRIVSLCLSVFATTSFVAHSKSTTNMFYINTVVAQQRTCDLQPKFS